LIFTQVARDDKAAGVTAVMLIRRLPKFATANPFGGGSSFLVD